MYCYPDTDVLINKLNIHDKAELKQAEEEFTAVKQMALLQEPIKGRFTKTHLFRIHRFLFEDVYPFAGHIRKEQISKGDTMFYPPDLIDRELERVFKNIHSKKLLAEQDEEKQIQNLSQTMAELNIIHPFREGNGRSIRELIRCMALEYGLHINWGNTDRETLINAAIAAVDDDSNGSCPPKEDGIPIQYEKLGKDSLFYDESNDNGMIIRMTASFKMSNNGSSEKQV